MVKTKKAVAILYPDKHFSKKNVRKVHISEKYVFGYC